MLTPTRAPLMKTPTGSAGHASSSGTLTHVHQAASLPVEQVEEPRLRDGPVVTPRPAVRSAGRYSRRSTEESHLSSSRSSVEPPAPSDAVRAASGVFSPKSDGDTARQTVGPDSHRDPEVWWSRTRTLQTKIPSTASDGLAPSAFDPSLECSTECGVVLAGPSYFWKWSPSSLVVDGVSHSSTEQFMMA